MIVYATLDALKTWLGLANDEDVPNGVALLRAASILVARACNRDLYVDAPTAAEAPVLSDATCAQAGTWYALGVDPAKGGTDFPAPVKRSTILDASVERDTSAQKQAVTDAANGLADQARDILLSAGLLWLPVPLGADTADSLPSWGFGPQPCGPFVDPLSGEYTWPDWGWLCA